MTDDRPEHPFDHRLGGDDRNLDELPLPEAGSAEFIELERLHESLSLLRAGRPSQVDRSEDPELASLLDVAVSVERPLRASTDGRPFQSFRKRSRAAILHELEQDRRAAQETSGVGGLVLPFLHRPIVAPVAAAAAAAALVIAAVLGGVIPVPGQTAGPSQVVSNLTQETISQELERTRVALATIQERTERGETVPAPLFREVAESAARVANIIERNPEQIDRQAVETYGQAMRTGQSVLQTARTDPEAEGALANAQRATADGDVVAARFLSAGEQEPAAEEPDPTATPEPTETPSPTPTESPVPTPTVAPDPDDEDEDEGEGNGSTGGDDDAPPAPTPATPTPAPDDTATP